MRSRDVPAGLRVFRAYRQGSWSQGGAVLLGVLFSATPAGAQPALDGGASGTGGQGPLSFVLVVGLVGLIPLAFMSLTAFVKISTVLQIVRSAIGVANVPSNTVVLALSLVLTLIAMAPLGSRIATRAGPLFEKPLAAQAAEQLPLLVEAVREPLRGFLRANASPKERARFFELARAARPPDARAAVADSDLIVLMPAFVVTELVEAFALGFALFLPFLVIELVVANVLLALGMQMTNPSQVSLPFKLLLFVAIDGWGLLAQALVVGYATG